jgi:hypothetical protein
MLRVQVSLFQRPYKLVTQRWRQTFPLRKVAIQDRWCVKGLCHDGQGDLRHAKSMMRPPVNIPVGSIYELQRSLHGVELSAYLSAEPVSEKKPSRLTDVAFHCVRPWLAAIDPKGSGLVWNYETRETVVEFSLGISPDVAALQGDAGDGDEEFGGSAATTTTTTTPTAAAAAKGLLQKAASPTASYVRSLRNKASSFPMLFYDHESVCWTTRSGGAGEPRSFFDEWLLVLTTTHIVVCDLNQPTAVGSVLSVLTTRVCIRTNCLILRTNTSTGPLRVVGGSPAPSAVQR